MKVRGWLLIGDMSNYFGGIFPIERRRGGFVFNLPNATNFTPGDWIVWQATPLSAELVVVCVDVPLGV